MFEKLHIQECTNILKELEKPVLTGVIQIEEAAIKVQ